MTTFDVDLAVIGAGSGGIAAALSAARAGLHVLVIEKAAGIGGTAVRAGVNAWEPGVGGTGIPFDIYRRLKRIPQAVGIYTMTRHCCAEDPALRNFPGAELQLDASLHYLDTLQRHGRPKDVPFFSYGRCHWHGVVFEPDPYVRVLTEMLAETGCCTVLTETALRAVASHHNRIQALTLSNGDRVSARAFIDATGDAELCRQCGCDTVIGAEPKSMYNEPGAPSAHEARVNGVTLIYRITPTPSPGIERLPPGLPETCWWNPHGKAFPLSCVNHYPGGDLNINMLPSMDGREFLKLGYEAAYQECRRRVRAHWHNLQNVFPEFQHYRIGRIAPELGVRESRRVLGNYVLTQRDLIAGLSRQAQADIITLADHAMDTHGEPSEGGEPQQPYGVPYRCLIPRGWRNLLAACRAASFSALAASSCRLTRTMMQIGQAAGTAAAIAQQQGVDLPVVPSSVLSRALREQHVELDWPRPATMIDYLSREDDA